MPPIIKASAAIATLPPIGLGIINIKAMKAETVIPNRPMTFNCTKSLAVPTSVLKSMGVFIFVMNLSTILRCGDPSAGAKGIESKNPKVPAAKTPKNLTWNVHVESAGNPK